MPDKKRRLAAIVALVAAALSVVSLLVLVFGDVLALVLALVALGLVGAFGWLALTRRGAARVVAAVLAAAAVVAVLVVLVWAEALWQLVAFVVCLAAFGAATAHALGGPRTAAAASPAPAAADRRPRPKASGRAVLLMNPKSGGGKVVRFDLENEARRRGIEPVVLGPDDDLSELAQAAVKDATIIGMAGGDGSQALVAQIAAAHGVPYVCIPAGTRNHLALDLGLNRDDVVGALDAYTAGTTRVIDLAEANGRVFVNNVSLGVYAEVVQSDEYRDAKAETFGSMLPDLLGPDAPRFDLRFTAPDGGAERTAQIVLVSNNPYRLDRIAGAGTRARMDTGELGVLAVEISGAAAAAQLLALEAVGQVSRFAGWRQWTTPTFELRSGSPIAAGVDGEALTMESPLRFVIRPAALTVHLPPTAGLAPAARAGLDRDTVRQLLDVARGR